MEKTYNIRQRHPSQLSIPSRQRAHSQGQGTLCGRLGQALRSDAYADFREGQLTLVNHSRSWRLAQSCPAHVPCPWLCFWGQTKMCPAPVPGPVVGGHVAASAYSQLIFPIKRRVPATSFQRYLAQL